MEHTNAQIALLRGELTGKMGMNLKYMAFSTGYRPSEKSFVGHMLPFVWGFSCYIRKVRYKALFKPKGGTTMHQTNNMIDSVHNLENADMNRAQAEALTKLIRDSVAESVQHLATKAELAELRQNMAELRAHVDAQHMETKAELAELRQNMATKAELAELGAQVLEVKDGLNKLKISHDAQAEHTNAQIALLRGELTEKMGMNLKYMAFSAGFSTIAIITALFSVFFGTPAVG